jgi:hypothetical protein
MNVAIINYKLIIKNFNRRLEVMPQKFFRFSIPQE